MQDDFRIGCGLEYCPTLLELVADGAGICDVAVMGDTETSAGKVGIEWLDITHPLATGC